MERLIFTGHVGHSAELRILPDGAPVVNFSVAVKRGFGDRERTQWYDCAWFGERAQKCADWITKGRLIAVEGVPATRAWLSRTEPVEARSALECRVYSIDFLGAGQATGDGPQVAEASVHTDLKKPDEPEEEVPF